MLKPATDADVPDILALKEAVAADQTAKFGKGPWSSFGTERGVRFAMSRATIYIYRRRGAIIGMLTLSKRKPWAIDASYFTERARPIYLTDLCVSPRMQRRGIGRRCLADVPRIARAWPADAIRLDAYEGTFGAGEFYRKSGYREVGRKTYRVMPLIYFELLIGPSSGV